MAELQPPSVLVAPSVRQAGRGPEPDHLHEYGAGVRDLTDDQLPTYVQDLLAQRHKHTPRPEGFVPATHLWWVEGSKFMGRVHIRHRLTPWLLNIGGHLGYYVVPEFRRRGHATAMLAAALPWAADLGLDCLLLTCDTDNVPSRKVIEAAGGLYQGEYNGKLRFWVPTRPLSRLGI